MDMWFMRALGRLAGSLPKFDEKLFPQQVDRFRNAMKLRGEASAGFMHISHPQNWRLLQSSQMNAQFRLHARCKKPITARSPRIVTLVVEIGSAKSGKTNLAASTKAEVGFGRRTVFAQVIRLQWWHVRLIHDAVLE
jgi:hypothetical protein